MYSDFDTLSSDDLKRIGQMEGEELLRALLRAECIYQGIPVLSLSSSLNINAADGGVDAKITYEGELREDCNRGIIPSKRVCYQVKTGDIKLTDGEIDKLVLNKDKTDLKPLLRKCLENDGDLVFCLFANDTPDSKEEVDEYLNKIEKVVKKKFSSLGEGKIHLWQSNQLQSIFKFFPSIVWKVKRRSRYSVLTHEQWYSSDRDLE